MNVNPFSPRRLGPLSWAALALAGMPVVGAEPAQANGIVLPDQPPADAAQYVGKAPPYLSRRPAVVPIEAGRQLLVDDFLIESTDLARHFHQPVKYEGNPVLRPETTSEKVGGLIYGVAPGTDGRDPWASAACSFDDGVCFDSRDGLYKLWYMSGHVHDTALAYSHDGLHWTRPQLDVVGKTNVVIPYNQRFARDAFAPWLDDAAADPAERYKAYLYVRKSEHDQGGYLYTSPDGVHWRERVRMQNGVAGDDTSIFYNPIRKKWAMSIRVSLPNYQRSRNYYESDTFLGLAQVTKRSEVFWTRANATEDPTDPTWIVQNPTQLYALSAQPYESLMLGLFSIHYGPENDACVRGAFPKLTQIKVGFSRDGFYWDRADRDVFIAASKRPGDWERGYLRATGAGCLTVGDKLYFYYCGFSGENEGQHGMYAGGSQNVAILRRDGFASMDAGEQQGTLTTVPVRFTGKYLFVNLAAPNGAMTVEILNRNGEVIRPFTAAHCMGLKGDSTMQRVEWSEGANLGSLAGQPVRFRFRLTQGGLYSFWVSSTLDGESHPLPSSPPAPLSRH